jgi:hypothetical protein
VAVPLSSTLAGVIGAVAGLAPHVLHHIGPLAGTALIAGAGGTAVFGCPAWSRRCRCSCGGAGSAPGGPGDRPGRVAVMFSSSAFVIGPAINSGGGPSGGGHPNPPVDHSGQYN